eukprot:CAMPEP_0197436756 /NCGR_PEP_ID=MMETSP1175-20131217/4168_1 /TAXON_ID=1003142 /ORGANISM="Triceratium dubium, Strain CCMP147" /LENGTH=87 /DNA_ID=CAMNT_0042966135 /DNA_START=205 /DNA_END=468 /DNA_ORIENTATION=-
MKSLPLSAFLAAVALLLAPSATEAKSSSSWKMWQGQQATTGKRGTTAAGAGPAQRRPRKSESVREGMVQSRGEALDYGRFVYRDDYL